jgi:hypothetical protein
MTKTPMPSEGGSYIRDKSGALKRIEAEYEEGQFVPTLTEPMPQSGESGSPKRAAKEK